ncbi:MAG: hypothetical protein HOO06_02090 [Bdellovibrionaceae bacterium]|nr:hypothetical protein [Pseudobdellovibrionaceae bacterium]
MKTTIIFILMFSAPFTFATNADKIQFGDMIKSTLKDKSAATTEMTDLIEEADYKDKTKKVVNVINKSNKSLKKIK